QDRVPLGYRGGRKQWDSMVYSATAHKYTLFGVLYLNRLMQQPQVFYCPSENDPRSMYGTPENPWPPGPDGDPAQQTYAGYGCRPETLLPDELQTVPGVKMPLLSQFRDKAILADLIATP